MPDTLSALDEVRISELPEASVASATDLLEASQLTSGQYVSRKLALDLVTTLIAGSSQIQAAIDAAIAAIPPVTTDWSGITGKPATFPPTLPIAQSGVTNLVSDLALKAPLASPHLTGIPTAPTAAQNTDTTQLATTQFVNLEIGGQLGFFLPLAGGTLTGPLLSNLATAPNQSAYRVTNYSLTANNTTSAFRIDGTLNTTGQPDIFAINITDTSNNGGSAFIIKGGPAAANILVRADMAGDLQSSGWHQAMSQSGLPAGGAYYFAYYLGNNSGGNVGLYAGLGAPAALDTFGRYGSIYLNGASPGIPYYNNNGGTGWDQLVGLTATQTLTNKTFAPASISPSGTNGQVMTTVAGVSAWAALASGASIAVGTTPPGSPGANALWWNSELGTLFIYYNDGNTTQWVPAAPSASGTVLQTVTFETGAVATGTTLIPVDDTIPQITEGNEYMTLAITPRSATSKLIINIVAQLSNGAAATAAVAAALFQDSTANALAATYASAGSSAGVVLSFQHIMTSGTTSPTTFRVRGGLNAAGTTTFNGVTAGRIFGGVMASSIVIREVSP